MNKKDYITADSKLKMYLLYERIIKKPKKYDDITRSIMCDEIENAIKLDYTLILKYCTEEELDSLSNFLKGNELIIFSLFVGNNKEYKDEIYDGYKPYIEKAINYYENNKAVVIEMKKKYYYALGLIYTFGALTIEEFRQLFNKYYPNENLTSCKDILLSPYLKEHTTLKGKNIYLTELEQEKKDILDTHTSSLKLDDSFETIVTRGHYVVDINDPLFIKIKKYKSLEPYINKLCLKRLICYAGFNNKKGYMESLPAYYLNKLNENRPGVYESTLFDDYFKNLPKFLIPGAASLTKENNDFFYKQFIPFIVWYSQKINHPIKRLPNNKVDQNAVAEVVDLASEKHFALADEYVKEKSLTGREKTFILGFKKSIYDTFIITEYRDNGALFMDRNSKVYLVKGLISSFKEVLPYDLPIAIRTLILPFDNFIIYNGVVNFIPIKFNKGTSNAIINTYKEKKIITSL